MKFKLYDERAKYRGEFERPGMPWGNEVLPMIRVAMGVEELPPDGCDWTAVDEEGDRYGIGYEMVPEGWCRLMFDPVTGEKLKRDA
jgi:hypothetical protein